MVRGNTVALTSRFLIVYPNIARAERFRGCLGVFGGKQIPLGLFYLAAYLRKYGCQVHAIDAEARRLPDAAIVAHLRQGEFDALGISTTTAVFPRAIELARTVKAALPRLPVIVGGPHVSSQPAESLDCEAFDYAIPREGEETLRETVELLESGSDPAGVKGLVYREGGHVLSNAARPYIEDLDSLPFPAYDLIPDLGAYHPPPFNYRRRPVANVITSRGCPNQCTFCANATFGRRLRMRSAESVVEEIEMLLRRFHVREIAFSDDNLTASPRRVYEIFELAARRGLRFPWSCRSRVNTVDEPLLRYMKANGCWYIAFGMESGDEEILKVIRKNISRSQVERAVELSHRAGLVTKGFFIVGHPKESLRTIGTTVQFAMRLNLDQVAVMLNTPLPGTYQYQHAEEYGSLDKSSWSAFTFWRPVFVPSGLTRNQLLAKHREFLARFYLRPGWLLRHALGMLAHPNTAVQLWHIAGDFIRLARPAHARRVA
jgi:radical SAM superfamily enzyme YgiQ (UPF0313 family)